MSPVLIDTNNTTAVASLPEIAFTRSKIAFRPNEDIWTWDDGTFRVHLDFQKLNLPVTVPTDSLKRTLLVFAKNNSPSHLTNLFQAMVHFLKRRGGTADLKSISKEEVSNYKATLAKGEQWLISRLNVLLQKWVSLGLDGVDPDCTAYLREIKKPGNSKGEAVRTRNPFKGPFSEAEYTSLYKAVDAAYGRDDIPRWVAVLTRLLFACGGRISQYASLKIADFTEKGRAYVLKLPQVKTREIHSRMSFKDFDISPQTGRLLMLHVQDLRDLGLGDDSALFPESLVTENGRVRNSVCAGPGFS